MPFEPWRRPSLLPTWQTKQAAGVLLRYLVEWQADFVAGTPDHAALFGGFVAFEQKAKARWNVDWALNHQACASCRKIAHYAVDGFAVIMYDFSRLEGAPAGGLSVLLNVKNKGQHTRTFLFACHPRILLHRANVPRARLRGDS